MEEMETSLGIPGLGAGERAAGRETPYLSPLDHLLDEAGWVRALLRRHIGRLRARGGLRTGGLAVSAEEADAILASYPHGFGAAEREGEGGEARDEVSAWRAHIEARLELSRDAGVFLPLPELAAELDLSPEDVSLLTLLAVLEVEPVLERVFCYAFDDFTRKRPTVGFVIELLGEGDVLRMDALRERLGAEAPLRRYHLVELSGEEGDGSTSGGPSVGGGQGLPFVPFLGRTVVVATRVVDHLRGRSHPDEAIRSLCQAVEPRAGLDGMVLPGWFPERLRAEIIRHRNRRAGPLRLHLHGPAGTGKKRLAEGLAAEFGHRLLLADWASLWHDRTPAADGRLGRIIREALLARAALYLDGADEVPDDGVPWAEAARVIRLLDACPTTLIVGATRRLPWLSRHLPGMVDLAVPFPDPEARAELWRRALPSRSRLSPRLVIEDLAFRYALPGGAIQKAADKALELARARSARNPTITPEDVSLACREQVTNRLSALASRIESSFTWSDVVLPQDVMERLRELAAYARHRRAVLDEWGFRRLLPYGQGLSVLFSGPPGTGKTMVAGILARELGMELFRVDLSRVVNKYIGETEKNLGRIFDEARDSHAVLLFDEADSLFSRRTDVRSSVDRYANLEVNYLLQRMEDYDGVTILTTNFEAAIDEAFKRRLKFRIAFPFPDVEERARMWRAMLPAEARVEGEIDFKTLGARFEMTGGHIKNAVLRAAVMAQEAGTGVTTQHLLAAAALEYREMGKLIRG